MSTFKWGPLTSHIVQVLDLVTVPKARIVLGIGSQWHGSFLPSQMINDWVIRNTLSQNCWVGRVEGTRIGRRRTRRRPRRLRTFNDNSTCAKLRLVQCQIYSDATRCTERNCGKKVTANRISGQCILVVMKSWLTDPNVKNMMSWSRPRLDHVHLIDIDNQLETLMRLISKLFFWSTHCKEANKFLLPMGFATKALCQTHQPQRPCCVPSKFPCHARWTLIHVVIAMLRQRNGEKRKLRQTNYQEWFLVWKLKFPEASFTADWKSPWGNESSTTEWTQAALHALIESFW